MSISHRAALFALLLLAVAVSRCHALPEYCGAKKEDVDAKCNDLLCILNRIVRRPYFRFFKVDTQRECPYWAVSTLCTTEGNPCSVCKCDANNVPSALHFDGDMSDLPLDRSTTVGGSGHGEVLPWQDDHRGFNNYFASHHSEYIDLVLNPESNTGYVGQLANRIWEEIYGFNCFSVQNGQSECREEIVFYKLLSGLHASISTHISKSFFRYGDTYFPNCDELRRRVLNSSERIDNLYTLYQFVLRAITLAKPTLQTQVFHTGNDVEDRELAAEFTELFSVNLFCLPTFNESVALPLSSHRVSLLVPRMKAQLRNITRLMDCLTCEKCRVWGKLQMLGLSTALKVVLAPPHQFVDLSRSEVVALINFARQLTVSMHAVANDCRPTTTSMRSYPPKAAADDDEPPGDL